MPQSGHSPETAMILGDGVFIVTDTLELELPLGWSESLELRLINQHHSFSGKMIPEL